MSNPHFIKALCVRNCGLGGGFTAADCKILNIVARKLVEYGAASEQRLASVTGLELISVNWALWHLEAVDGGTSGLWSLPGDPL